MQALLQYHAIIGHESIIFYDEKLFTIEEVLKSKTTKAMQKLADTINVITATLMV